MTLSDTINYGVPPASSKSVLLAFLAASKTNQEEILDHVRPLLNSVQIQPWRSSSHLLQSVAVQGKHHDSMANIYGLAIVAYRAGWSQFLVADELTDRQISGYLRCCESPDVSLTMVSVAAGEERAYPSDVRVVAKRITVDGLDGEEDLYKILRTFDVSLQFAQNDWCCQADIFGLQLHDADRGVFSPNTALSLAREESLQALEMVQDLL